MKEYRNAVEYSNGGKAWWINGLRYSEQDWEQEVIRIKLERVYEKGI